MASQPYPDRRRGIWRLKYKPHPNGPWETVTLGKDPRLKSASPPRKPPPDIAALAVEFARKEYLAKHGLADDGPRPVGLAEYVEDYLRRYRESKKGGSYRILERACRQLLGWCSANGVLTVQGLTEVHCADYLEARLREISPATLKTERGYLGAIWTRAVAEKIIPYSPWPRAKIKKPTKAEKTPRFWTAEEVAALVRAFRTPWHRDLVVVLVNTGIRVSGCLQMRWDWIDWERSAINVPGRYNKGGFAYSTILTDAARDVLRRRLAESRGRSRFVFPSRLSKYGEIPPSYRSAQSAFKRCVRRARVPTGTLHDLRHTFARALHMAGVPQSVISRLLGHSSMKTTEIYTQIGPQDALEVMKTIRFGLG